MQKICRRCNGQIKGGRSDRKYCSATCRSHFNNDINSQSNNYMRNVNTILRRNKGILENLIPEEAAKVSKSTLTHKGFDFNYYTNSRTNTKGNIYYYCYEYGYMVIDEESCFLVRGR